MAPRFLNGIFGTSHHLNPDPEFHPNDDRVRFNRNLQTQPSDWIYRNKKLLYLYNSYGHRSIEPGDLKEGYFLFLGCSHTEGIGLALEDCYSHIVSKHCNRQYYNLAIGGSGPDMQIINAMQFLSFVKVKPSKVIIQWPSFHRFFSIEDGGNTVFYNPAINDISANYTPHERLMWKTMTIENDSLKKNSFFRMMFLEYLNNLGIQDIYECFDEVNKGWEDDDEYEIVENRFPTYVETKKVRFRYWNLIDTARDLIHPGIEMNRLYADRLIESFSQ